MAPQTKFDITYMHLTHRPSTGKKQLHKFWSKLDKPEMTAFLHDQQQWVGFNGIHSINTEVSKLPANANVRFNEYGFVTSNDNLFELRDMTFEKILLILGEQKVYWTFYMFTPDRLIQGSAPIPLKYCNHCIPHQYEDIINTVKQYIVQKK